MDKLKEFSMELGYIQHEGIREFAKLAIQAMPDYFFLIPASSSGKYHPKYTLGEGGLLRHTRAACKIAVELFRMEEYTFTNDEMDIIITSLILHDGWKQGLEPEGKTQAKHPEIAGYAVYENDDLRNAIDYAYLVLIINNIVTHMGQWNTDRTGEIILQKPETKMEKFVHLCDYLASRKSITVDLEQSN
jgi:ribosomal protein S15P/S13E